MLPLSVVLSWVHIAILHQLITDHLGKIKCPAGYFLLHVHRLYLPFPESLKTSEESSYLSPLARQDSIFW